MNQSELEAAIQHLRTDPIMAQLVETYPAPLRHPSDAGVFVDLVESIIDQQLSSRVADVIRGRVYQIVPRHTVTPDTILAADVEALRASGVSYAKIRYMRAAAEAAISGLVDFASLTGKTDSEVVAELIQIKGVGQWTAEMMLMFSLQRPDVFSIGDLGLRTAVGRLYGIDRNDRPRILHISEPWSPYRTLASRYLWRSLENRPDTEKAG